MYPLGTTDVLPILISLYALAVYRSVRAAWIAFGVSLVVATASAYIAAAALDNGVLSPFGADAPASASQFGVLMLIATLIGVTMGNRRRYLVALIDRARDLARERDQQAELATARERARIAREMHDIVSHSLTVMVTLADGSAATSARDPERAADAMRRVAETGREALGDMRRMLGLLSEPGDQSGAAAGELAPQPDLRALPELVDDFRALGMPVTLRTQRGPDHRRHDRTDRVPHRAGGTHERAALRRDGARRDGRVVPQRRRGHGDGATTTPRHHPRPRHPAPAAA